ncbi:MAG TPA: hypothetical protein VHE55_11285 [Fimbriimonadaceae bacterium]|nr:hypothetical protein [Fimbriimonadaceae bacterium]
MLSARPSLSIQTEDRLSKHLSLHEKIVSLSDLVGEISQKTGVPLFVKRRVADRKVTIVFRDRPAREAMDRVASCMGMGWQPVNGDGFELDLTPEEASAEAKTEASEREQTRSGVRDAVREIKRLWDLGPAGRNTEMAKLDKAYKEGLKNGESPESPHMQLLGSAASALHMVGFIEVVGPALASAKLDDDGVPVSSVWFSSADVHDPVGHLFPDSIPTRPGSGGYSDAIGVVNYREESHEIQTRLFAVSAKDGADTITSVGTWAVATSSSAKPSELELATKAWARPPAAEFGARAVREASGTPPPSEYCSGMYGRADLLVDFADRSGMPIVANAYRRSLTSPAWLAGTTVQKCLDSYAKICRAPWKGQPDAVREEDGWLLFRKDHWWWADKAEIPESVIRPLEEEAAAGRSPLPLEDYARLAAGLKPDQLAVLERPETVLFRFPIGSLSQSDYSLTLFGLLDEASRNEAFSNAGVALSASSPQAQDLAYNALVRMCVYGGDLPFIRAVLRGKSVLKNYRFYAEDGTARATSPLKIGDGRDISLSFSYGTPSNQYSQTFACSKAGP